MNTTPVFSILKRCKEKFCTVLFWFNMVEDQSEYCSEECEEWDERFKRI
jgi:hypothetical protein